MEEIKEMRRAILVKDSILSVQTKRIKLLEEKMAELRKKYFLLKYADIIIH